MSKIWMAEVHIYMGNEEMITLGAFDSEEKANDAMFRFKDELKRNVEEFSSSTDEDTEETLYSWSCDLGFYEEYYNGIVYPLELNKYR